MNTRITTAASSGDAHVAALAKAMAEHPCVGVELNAMRKQLDAANRKAVATQSVLDDLAKSLGTKPATASAAPQEPTDAEVEEIVGKMSPAEKALVLMKAAPATRFTLDSAAQSDGVFRR